MKIENPFVTLADDARIGVKEEVRSGFLDWLMSFSVKGDDGEIYTLGGAILSMNVENMDVVSINISKDNGGKAVQLEESVYKIGKYPGMLNEWMFRNPAGTLKIEHREHSIFVTCGKEYSVECFDNNTWHIMQNSGDGVYSTDLWHRPHHAPLWYGRETPSYLTQHSITYGYNWVGDVDGEIILDGRKIKVKGLGIRERYVAVDSSAAELGGWEDWGWVAFNEIHSSFYDMRLGMKDFVVYDLDRKKYYPEEKMTIRHEDWVFYRDIDGFIPSIYNLKFELEDGIYEVRAQVVNATTWGATHKVPDNPVATITFDTVEGKFTDRDGNVRILTGGRGVLSIRQWHAYPRVLPRELYIDEVQEIDCINKFDTL